MTERFRVVWTDAAVNDLLAIVGYIAERGSVSAAEDLHKLIMDAVCGLEALPRRYGVVPELSAEGMEAYRELLVGPYRIMFGLRGGEVVVLAAVDGRHDLVKLLIERALHQP